MNVEESGVSCLCHLLPASFTFASSLSLDSQPFLRFSLPITEEDMAPWNRQPEEKVVQVIWGCRMELGGLACPAQHSSVTP